MPIDKLAGLVVTANGKTLPWKRDPLNVYAFHVDVPEGANNVDVEFQFLSPQDTRQGRVVMTPEMLNVQWNAVSLYPAGYYTNHVKAETSVKLPTGWQYGSALELASRDGDTVHFKPIDYANLVDSPIYAGKYFKRVDLDPGAKTPVFLNIVADDAKFLEIKPEQLKVHQNLVQQMYKLYGAHHYDHYDFLFSLSDKMSGNGLEHHRSSENGVDRLQASDELEPAYWLHHVVVGALTQRTHDVVLSASPAHQQNGQRNTITSANTPEHL